MEMYFQLMESYALDAGMALQCRWGPSRCSGPTVPLNRLNLYVGRENVTTKTTSSGPQYQWVKLDEARSSKITAHNFENHSESCLIGGLEPWNIYDFPFSWECHHPNQRGCFTTNQMFFSTPLLPCRPTMAYPLDPVPSTPPGMGSATVFYRLGRMYLAEGQDGAMSRKRYGGWFYPIYV